jgi:hypothetical protein
MTGPPLRVVVVTAAALERMGSNFLAFPIHGLDLCSCRFPVDSP